MSTMRGPRSSRYRRRGHLPWWLPGVLALVIGTAFLARMPTAADESDAQSEPEAAATAVLPAMAAGVDHVPEWPPPDLAGLCADSVAQPLQPPPGGYGDQSAAIAAVLERYHRRGIDYTEQLQNYSATGDYLNYGVIQTYKESAELIFDANGVPKLRHGGIYYYNPVTVAQYALTMHGRYLRGAASLESFVVAADTLAGLQDGRGAFPYPFAYYYYLTGETFPAGWVSGMAQGLALSVFERAYALIGEPRFLASGNSALEFLLVPSESGGPRGTLADLDPALGAYVSFKEYPSTPDNYTLNGHMYTLLGLYDWWQLGPDAVDGPSALAHRYFECGLATVLLTLPLYDVGGFSSYDLGQLIAGAEPNLQQWYHAFHISLLHALRSVTGNDALRPYEELWASYILR
jgi:hypothetical protein